MSKFSYNFEQFHPYKCNTFITLYLPRLALIRDPSINKFIFSSWFRSQKKCQNGQIFGKNMNFSNLLSEWPVDLKFGMSIQVLVLSCVKLNKYLKYKSKSILQIKTEKKFLKLFER